MPRRLSGKGSREGDNGQRRFACGLYPSHGPLRFITGHSRFALASTMRKTKRLRRRLISDHVMLPHRGPMTSWAPAHVQTLSQPHSSSRGRELTRNWERAYYSYLHAIAKESVWYAETNKIYTRKKRLNEPKNNFTRTSFFPQC